MSKQLLNPEQVNVGKRPKLEQGESMLDTLRDEQINALKEQIDVLEEQKDDINEDILELNSSGRLPYPVPKIIGGLRTTICLYTDDENLQTLARSIANDTFDLIVDRLGQNKTSIIEEVEHTQHTSHRLCVNSRNRQMFDYGYIRLNIDISSFVILVKVKSPDDTDIIIGICCGSYNLHETYPIYGTNTIIGNIIPMICIDILCATNGFSLVGTIILRFLKQIVALNFKDDFHDNISSSYFIFNNKPTKYSIILFSTDSPETQTFYMNSGFVRFNGKDDEGIPCIWLLQFEMGYYESLTMGCIIPMTSVKVRDNAVSRVQSSDSQLKELKLSNNKLEVTRQIDYIIDVINTPIIQKLATNRHEEVDSIIANLQEEIAKLQNGGKRIRKSRKKCKSRKIHTFLKSQRKV